MKDIERSGCTTRYEPASTVKKPAANAQSDASPARPVVCDESELFASGPGPRLFGEGSYSTGGPVAEGHYALPDPNPQGGYGRFNDAGGYGATTLLGEKTAQACEPKKEDRGAGK